MSYKVPHKKSHVPRQPIYSTKVASDSHTTFAKLVLRYLVSYRQQQCLQENFVYVNLATLYNTNT